MSDDNNKERTRLSDHDLLVRIDERVEKVEECMKTHLQRHWAVTVLALGALISGAISLSVAMWNKL